jgi:preprotein translocase subunit SecF
MLLLNKTKYFLILSGLIILAGLIVGIAMGGLNLGLDFTGGSILTIDLGEKFDMQVVEQALEDNGVDPALAQITRSGDTQAVIRIQQLPSDENANEFRQGLLDSLKKTYPEASGSEIESVGGVTSGEIVTNAFLSVIIAAALMLIYIWIRFELFSGIAAVVALIHDVLIMTAVMSIARIPVNSSYIAACLTIVGYSINDTIVVFDRIRENRKKVSLKSMTQMEIADLSVRETLPRTMNTSLTTLITILAVYIFGVPSIKEFALPIIVGLVAGTYSSMFIASPIWMKLLELKRQKHLAQTSEKKGRKAKAKA